MFTSTLLYFATIFVNCFFALLNSFANPVALLLSISVLNDFISPTRSDSKSPTSPTLFVFTSSKTLSENADILPCAFAPYCNTCVASSTFIFLLNSSIASFSSCVKLL